MEEAITRLKFAADAGADVCFIEGVQTKELLESTVAALAPKPVSISMNPRVILSFLKLGFLGPRQRDLRRTNPFVHT
jgi:2-methylisocitrate lyase-like PEP mutase family enzyme